MPSRLCPLADTTSQWWDSRFSGGEMEGNVIVTHTTETPSWPGYGSGAAAPHMTYLWRPGMTMKQKTRQHFSLLRSARALVDAAGGVATNRGNSIQIELVGTCDPTYYKRWKSQYPHLVLWTDPPEEALNDVAEIVRWLDGDLPKFNPAQRVPRGWVAYPQSYGLTARQRLTFVEWNNFYGICGHQHVPENDHGDPGNFPIERLLSKVLGTTGGAGPLPLSPEEDDMPYTPQELRTMMREEAWNALNARMWQPLHADSTDPMVKSTLTNNLIYMSLHTQMIPAIAAKLDIDVDEAALAKALAETLIPVVRESLLESGVAEATADAVVAKLGSKLA